MGAFSDLRLYVAVTSPYPWDRGVTLSMGTMGHVILGRTWLFDLDVTLREKSNTCTFTHEGQRIKLIPSQSKTKIAEMKHFAQGQKWLNLINLKEFKREVVHDNRPRHFINLSLRT